MDKREVAEKVVDLLNEALGLDPVAVQVLTEMRVRCNAALANHPTIQVSGEQGGGATVGVLGLLNGLLADPETGDYLTVQFNNTRKLLGFAYGPVQVVDPRDRRASLLKRLERLANFVMLDPQKVATSVRLHGKSVRLEGGVGGRFLFREEDNSANGFLVSGLAMSDRFDLGTLEQIVCDAEQLGHICDAATAAASFRPYGPQGDNGDDGSNPEANA